MRVRATVKVCHLETKKKKKNKREDNRERQEKEKNRTQNIERQVREIRRRTVHIVLVDIHKSR